ncbi:hypothetical protein POM88_001200 [Heracleum sosnowskyi]|uniref:Uncharacterized protein n=1 Tax=Heracleum sosnowskyi TaxID=360622 RepID=A0AAD8N4S3_9APIA|nr:hypothetical protein POM88_001200 [Heracleum sosnowskyi]
MDLVAQRYLVTVSGNDGKRVLSDAWALDTAQKPYAWQKLTPDGDRPSARILPVGFLYCAERRSSMAFTDKFLTLDNNSNEKNNLKKKMLKLIDIYYDALDAP